MKILIVGLGSIGKRHLGILKEMPKIEVAALRTSKGTMNKPEEGIKEFYKLTDALNFEPDGVIISNPTSLHIESALPFLEKGIKVLIEKPVAHLLEDAKRLEPHAAQLRVAYCMRFLDIYIWLGQRFKEESPFKVGFRRSFYLPHWHPYADYRLEYTARKDLGGGVIRTLSHEIDLAVQWFGTPIHVQGAVDQVSFLEMKTDDYAFFTLRSESGVRVNFDLDFFAPININQGEAFTKHGRYTWDFQEITFTGYDERIKTTLYSSKTSDVNHMYVRQLEDFLGFIRGENSYNANLDQSMTVLEIIEQLEPKS